MLVKYQRIWEGSSLTTPAAGVIVFYPLIDGLLQKIWLRVREPVTHPLRWAIYYGDTNIYVTDFTIEVGQVSIGITLSEDFPVEMFTRLRLDLIETNGGIANIPVVIEYGIEETVELSYNDLQDIPETFSPAAHNHNDLYYGKEHIDDIVSVLESDLASREVFSRKGEPNGYAPLDLEGKLPIGNLTTHNHDSQYIAQTQSVIPKPTTGNIAVAESGALLTNSGAIGTSIQTLPNSSLCIPGKTRYDIYLTQANSFRFQPSTVPVADIVKGFDAGGGVIDLPGSSANVRTSAQGASASIILVEPGVWQFIGIGGWA